MKTALRLPLPRQWVLGLLGGAAMLLAEIRFEHRLVLAQTWHAWIPVLFAALLFALGVIALVRWDRGGRETLLVLFALAVAVGVLGIWFHSGGHPVKRLLEVLAAWTLEPGEEGATRVGGAPPILAPAAFCGLGFLGVSACLRRKEHA
jgi:hypothetical protein